MGVGGQRHTSSRYEVNNTIIVNYMLYSRSKDYMFRQVVVIIRSLSFDTLKIIYILFIYL